MNKKNATKYENMANHTSNLTMAAKYLDRAIKYKKETLNSCFYSAFDKEKINTTIDEMKTMKKDILTEARQQNDNAQKRDITIRHRY